MDELLKSILPSLGAFGPFAVLAWWIINNQAKQLETRDKHTYQLTEWIIETLGEYHAIDDVAPKHSRRAGKLGRSSQCKGTRLDPPSTGSRHGTCDPEGEILTQVASTATLSADAEPRSGGGVPF